MLTSFVSFFAKRPRQTLGLWAVLLIVGAVMFVAVLPRNGFPSVDVPIALAQGDYLVDDREAVDADVIQPMIAAVEGLPEVESISTWASDNGFTFVAELDSSLTSAYGARLLVDAFADIGLPDAVAFDVLEVDAALLFNEYALLAAVQGPLGATPAELEAAAAPVVEALAADRDIERAVVLDLLVSGTDPNTGSEITIQQNFNELSLDSGPLLPAVSIGVAAAEGVDAIGIDAAATRALEGIDMPEGFTAEVSFEQATQIRGQISSLLRNVFTGIVAVAVVSLLLISWRASLITALFIVTVMAVAMIVLWVAGISLNTISLFGLILTLGLFVDDAIVIVEAIDAFREEGRTPIEVIRRAIGRVGAASVSGTLTTVLVFAPMLFVSGVLGDFIRQLPITVILGLILSLILSLLFIPTATRVLLLGSDPRPGLLSAIEARVARGVAALPAMLNRRKGLGRLFAAAGVALSLLLTFAGLQIAGQVGFNIFPAQSDSNEISIEFEFDPGTTIEQATVKVNEVNEIIEAEAGEFIDRNYVYFGNSRSAGGQLTLVDLGSREPTSHEIVEQIEAVVEDVDGARVTVGVLSNGPPESEFPFSLQIFGSDADTASVLALAQDIQADLESATFERSDGTTFTVVETQLDLADIVARVDGRRYVEVLAQFDDDDTTTLLSVTEDRIKDQFGADTLAARGLPADTLGFDFGQETENEESFGSTVAAFGVALILMFLLLMIQFRSLLQPLLVFLAIPFSFFGVFGGLWLTGHPISFFVMLGLIGLIGIAVNNTILLTDFANQERRAGADRVTAIETAIRRRFRPLIATTLTTVAGLLPLALTDPFWESLAFTIIFGLLSSTLLVVLSFPYYYLFIEWLRDLGRSLVRRARPKGASTSAVGHA